MRYVFLLLLLQAGVALSAQKKVIIRGQIAGDTKGYNKVYFQSSEMKMDSVFIKDGKFEYQFTYIRPVVLVIYSEFELHGQQSYRPAQLVIDRPGIITMSGLKTGEGMRGDPAKGMPSVSDFAAFQKQMKKNYASYEAAIAGRYDTIPLYDTPEYEQYARALDSVVRLKLPSDLRKIMAGLSDSYGTAYGLEVYSKGNIDPDTLQVLVNGLGVRAKRSPSGNNLLNYLEGVKRSAIGSKVQDFSIKGTDGSTLSLASLKGKYVWIDFWASWCGPCKESFPKMKELYTLYQGKPLEIWSISIDKDKVAWQDELKKQALPWLQGYDDAGISHKGFAVTAIPTGFLIDPDGKIILREVGFEENGAMAKKLKELFGK